MVSSSESSDAKRILGYSFRNPRLLEEALTHSTFSDGTMSYERLEFVGDKALSLALAKHWYSSRPNFGPRHLSALESANLCNNNLARVALRLGIYPLIRHNCPGLDKEVEEFKKAIMNESEKDHIHDKSTTKVPKVLADVFEAIAAAIYEDSNFNLKLMWKVVKILLEPLITWGQIRKTTPSNLHMKNEKDAKFCKVAKGHTTQQPMPRLSKQEEEKFSAARKVEKKGQKSEGCVPVRKKCTEVRARKHRIRRRR